MSDQLRRRLREAQVSISAEQFGAYVQTVEGLTTGSVRLADELNRLRLSFGLDVEESGLDRFDDQLAGVGFDLDRREMQLRRVIAGCVVVGRFERRPGSRKAPALAADTAAALAAKTLLRTGETPFHPDVGLWADYWVSSTAMHLRAEARARELPAMSFELPEAEEGIPPEQASEQAIAALAGRVENQFTAWSRWIDEIDQGRRSAHAEQIALLWWLESRDPHATAAVLVAEAAKTLLARVSDVPGPPGASALLRRKLSEVANQEVTTGDLRAAVDINVPEGVADLCPLLGGRSSPADKLIAADAAEWVFDELSIVRIAEESA